MTYKADYLADDPRAVDAGGITLFFDRGVTLTIYADNDEAAHSLALLHIPDGMALHSVYRAEEE